VAETTLRSGRRQTSSAPPASGEQARVSLQRIREGFTTWEADHGIAVGTLKQCAAELQVLLQAMQHGCADHFTHAVLLGIASKMEVAAELAELEESEAADG
jgi:hypothetical protein